MKTCILPGLEAKPLQTVGLNVLDKDDKVEVAGGFFRGVARAKEEEIARFEKRIQECQPSQPFWKAMTISKPFKAIYVDESTNAYLKKKLLHDCSKDRFMNALASLPSSEIPENERGRPRAEFFCQFCQTTYNFDENDLEELIRRQIYHTFYDWQC